MAHGGKREGAGRPADPESKRQAGVRVGALVTAREAATLRQYNQAQAFGLLASGLALGSGNLPELTGDEVMVLQTVLTGSVVGALFIRHLADEVAEVDHPATGGLLAKLNTPQVGDWERLALVLKVTSRCPDPAALSVRRDPGA